MVKPKKKLCKKKRRKGNDQEILETSKMLKNWHHGYEKNTVRVLTERYNNVLSALTLSHQKNLTHLKKLSSGADVGFARRARTFVFIYRVSQKFVPLLYKSVFQYDWTWYAIHFNKSCVFQSNSLFSYLLYHILTQYSICVLPRQRCACASIFSGLFFLYCSNSFLVFVNIKKGKLP